MLMQRTGQSGGRLVEPPGPRTLIQAIPQTISAAIRIVAMYQRTM
jgi:hypothetical protein